MILNIIYQIQETILDRSTTRTNLAASVTIDSRAECKFGNVTDVIFYFMTLVPVSLQLFDNLAPPHIFSFPIREHVKESFINQMKQSF